MENLSFLTDEHIFSANVSAVWLDYVPLYVANDYEGEDGGGLAGMVAGVVVVVVVFIVVAGLVLGRKLREEDWRWNFFFFLSALKHVK